jgi:hypothetical protein
MATNTVSRDALFDYSLSIQGISNEIVLNEEQITSLDKQIIVLQNTIGYPSIIALALEDLISKKNILETTNIELQSTLDEINVISNLPSETKDLLYYFYTVIKDSRVNFMIRMPFNYQAAIIDPNIQELLADTTNSKDNKTAIAQLVYQNYPISFDHIRSLLLINKFIT